MNDEFVGSEAGKAYMASEYWNTSNPASSYVVMANATTVEYVLGSYLMGKQQASSMYATMQFEFKQLAAPVGVGEYCWRTHQQMPYVPKRLWSGALM